MITITRKELYLSVDNTTIPSQGSSDVKVLFNNDTESYKDYLIEPRVGYYANGCPKSVVCEYSIDKKMIIIPKEAFNQNGVLVIAIALIDNNDSNHIEVTKPISFEVSKAPNEAIVLPNDDTWQTAVDNLVEQLFNKDYAPQFNEIEKKLNGLVTKANDLQKEAEKQQKLSNDLLNDVTETVDNVNSKLENGEFIPQFTMGTVETLPAGQPAKAEITGTRKQPILNLDIPQGATGPQGAQGIQGLQGQKGAQGERGLQGIQGPIGPKGDVGNVGPQGATGPQGAQGIQGPKGDKGDKGDRGTSGITTPLNGFFTLYVDSNGNLYARTAGTAEQPPFRYDESTGNLYWENQ